MNGWRRCHGLFFRFVESDLQGFFIPLVLGRIQFPQLLCFFYMSRSDGRCVGECVNEY